eukprot:4426509-Pleurochrysis_carterae.AAC.1
MASGGKPHANATGGSDVLNPSPPTLTPTTVLLPRTGLQLRVIAGGTPNEATESAPVVDGQCDRVACDALCKVVVVHLISLTPASRRVSKCGTETVLSPSTRVMLFVE